MSTTVEEPTVIERPALEEGGGGRTLRPRHIVHRTNGVPDDRCLCGYLWDVYPIPYDPEAGICAKCLAEYQRLTGGLGAS